ncbi:MAG: IgGFc-binding protein [Myxococcota bacterium]
MGFPGTHYHLRRLSFVSAGLVAGLVGAAACSASNGSNIDGPSGPSSGSVGGGATGDGGGLTISGVGGGTSCEVTCSPDLRQVLDCRGDVIESCTGNDGCDPSTGTCTNACDAAAANKRSVGCSYFATDMANTNDDACFAAFIANTWDTPARIELRRGGQSFSAETFVRIPRGLGSNVTYEPYDPALGLAPGEVAIAFLSGTVDNMGLDVPCPITPAVVGDASVGLGSDIGLSFEITTDVPVVAYQMNPFGGGSAAVTGASLLLPTSVWDTNYIGVNAYEADFNDPSMNIVATQDDTTVTIVPVADITGGPNVPSCAANTPCTYRLDRGENLQLTEENELTGSVVQSDKPVGLLAGHPCMTAPVGTFFCDHGEQMVPPVQALGSEYVGVMHRPRSGEPAIWRVVGAVDGTQLSYSSDVGGPATLDQGQVAEFITDVPFVVRAQDGDHPFMLFTYMSGSQWERLADDGGYGDADFVASVPPDQYLQRYVFFADPTYPETNLVIVRRRDAQGVFQDVSLDCAGHLDGWQPLGSDYEWTRFDLSTGDFKSANGVCQNGSQTMESDAPFGLWVWGWGTPDTTDFTRNVSYGYPGGMNVQPINTVVVPPIPK